MSLEKGSDKHSQELRVEREHCCQDDGTEASELSTEPETQIESPRLQEFIDIHNPTDSIGTSVEECGEDLRSGGSTIAEVTEKLSQQCVDSEEEFHSAEEESCDCEGVAGGGNGLDIPGDKYYACVSDGVNESENNCVNHGQGEVRTDVGCGPHITTDRGEGNRIGCGDQGAEAGNNNRGNEDNCNDDLDSEEEKEKTEAIDDDEEYRKKVEESLSDDEKLERKNQAQEIKDRGNQSFREGSYKEAIKLYNEALQICPLSFPKERSIMFSNRAACQMKLEDTDDAIKSCSKALELHPHYMKALLRRAELYEKADKLDEALADYQKAVELDPSQHAARHATLRLADQVKERNEKMKAEMLGKLKDLGNMILRPFGMSTDNFQLQQDPQTGSYSINFQQNKEK